MSLRDSDDLDGASSPTIEDEDERLVVAAPAPSVARRRRGGGGTCSGSSSSSSTSSSSAPRSSSSAVNRFRKAIGSTSPVTNITIGGGAAAAPREAEVVAPPQREQGPSGELTETFWPFYGAAAGVGAAIAGAWLALLGRRAGQMMKVSVHSLTTYLAVISHFFWGVAFAVGALLQFLYVMSVLD
ncbi:hypothetical protein ACMD2_21494, partial [Ananas comosus]